MPSLIDLRRRIRSVKNTQQITKAMKMVSAAKLRRAQEKVLAARPYSSVLREMMASILGNEPEDSPALAHPLLARRKEDRILVLLLTGDKGLCGAFNSNVIRRSQQFLAERSSAAKAAISTAAGTFRLPASGSIFSTMSIFLRARRSATTSSRGSLGGKSTLCI